MKIVWIERTNETNNFYLTKAKFKTWWGKEFVSTCITEKNMQPTKYFETGNYIPVNLWTTFLAFLETDLDYIQP